MTNITAATTKLQDLRMEHLRPGGLDGFRNGKPTTAVEAWCDDLGRWVLLDPLNAALYEAGGVPQSAVEIHDALVAHHTEGITIVRLPLLPGAPGSRSVGALPGASAGAGGRSDARSAGMAAIGAIGASVPASDAELLSYFYGVAVSTRNDFARLDRPLTIAEREGIFCRYADPRAAPFRHLNFALASARREDFLAPMDQVQIEVHTEPDTPRVHLAFSTRGTCPHFLLYRYRIAGEAWTDSGPLISWNLAPGENRLEVRAVNAFGIEGPVFRLRLRG